PPSPTPPTTGPPRTSRITGRSPPAPRLGLVLDSARPQKFPLPLSATAHQMFLQASASGLGGEDDSAVIKIFPGIGLPQPVNQPQPTNQPKKED
ncbi:hypothetical protein ABZT45_45500, partial [Streptomyces sp. NPDC005356]